MASVTISTKSYFSYASLAQADLYLNASVAAEDWQSEDTSDDLKGRGLVTGTRWINSVSWAGEPDDPSTGNAFPRKGQDIPTAIINATIELANLLITDPELQSDLADPSIKRLKAGSVEIEYTSGALANTQVPFPKFIMDMVRPYLGDTSIGNSGGAKAFGVHYQSKFLWPYSYTRPM